MLLPHSICPLARPSWWPGGSVFILTASDRGVDPGFPQSSHYSKLKIGALEATLPGAWHDRVNAKLFGQVSVCFVTG